MRVISGDDEGPEDGSRVGVSSFRKQSSVVETAASNLSPLSAARSSSVREYQEG